jgi:hypothetical protein
MLCAPVLQGIHAWHQVLDFCPQRWRGEGPVEDEVADLGALPELRS